MQRPTFAMSPIVLTLSAALLPACGGSSPEASAPASQSAAPAEAEEEMSDEEAEALAAVEAEMAALDEEMGEAPATEAGADGQGKPQREVTYRVSGDGLRVQTLGAEFTPSVKAVRVSGGWGLELSVEGSSSVPLVLYSPQAGPLAFGGKVQRKNGTVETFGDRREGGTEMALGPDSPQSFTRTWPEGALKPLAAGDSVQLHVGLWGLGQTSETRRPVKRFVYVTMTASKSGAQPVLQPPPQ